MTLPEVDIEVTVAEVTVIGQITLRFGPDEVEVPNSWEILKKGSVYEKLSAQ